MRLLYVSRTTGPHDARFAEAWRQNGVELHQLAIDPTHAAAGAELTAELESFAPDLVQAGPLSDVAPFVADHWNGPLIAASWGFDLLRDVDEDPRVRARVASVLARAQRILVDNGAARAVAVALGAPEERLVQFPWGVDLQFFTPKRRRAHDHLLVLSTRNHEAMYDVQTVLEAFIRAAPSSATLRLALAGSGSLTPQLRERAADAGLADRVSFYGTLDAAGLRNALHSADLYVSSSFVDGSSISLLEAMASGTPVCVTAIPGNAEWVDDSTGLSFAPSDTEALAAILGGLGSAREQLAARALAARARIELRADWRATVARFPEIARGAMARG